MSQVRVTRILEGPRNAAFHVFIEGDGSAELVREVIIDPEEFDPALDSAPGITVQRLWYDLTGFDGFLAFEYLASDTPVWTMTGDQYADVDLCLFGGLKDRSAEDGTGKLILSTSGLGAGERGTLIVFVRKN